MGAIVVTVCGEEDGVPSEEPVCSGAGGIVSGCSLGSAGCDPFVTEVPSRGSTVGGALTDVSFEGFEPGAGCL